MSKVETVPNGGKPSALAQRNASEKRALDTLKQLRARVAAGTYFPRTPVPNNELPLLVTDNTLPDNSDGQTNTLPFDELVNGITVTLNEWPMTPLGFEVQFAVDDDELGQTYKVDTNFGSLQVTLPLGDKRYDHGPHRVRYHAIDKDDDNGWDPEPTLFYIDIFDPNLGSEPDKPLLPSDLADGMITPDYLDTNGGVTFTLPTPADHKEGDTYSFFLNGSEVVSDQPLPNPFDIFIDRSIWDGLPASVYNVQYSLTDRAGNHTDMSSPEKVTLTKTPAPVLRPPIVSAGGFISLSEARAGVDLRYDYDTPEFDDMVNFTWQQEHLDPIWVPTEFQTATFADILKGGRQYTGQVTYQVNRHGAVYQSPPQQVDVDLSHTGPGNPDEPDPVNPLLELAVLTSFTNQTNLIEMADRDQPASITVPLYDNAAVGEMIQVYYGDEVSEVGAPVALAAGDITADEIIVQLPWGMIQDKGNGNIRLFYRIYPNGSAENWQQSRDTPVVVSVNNIDDLPVAIFPDRNVAANIINCDNTPWLNGVNVQMDYPSFEENDAIELHWVMDSTYPALGDPIPTTPIEETRTKYDHRVTLTEASAGTVVFNVPWGTHMSVQLRGAFVVYWSLKRDNGDISGTSDLNYVRLSRTTGGSEYCGPHPDD